MTTDPLTTAAALADEALATIGQIPYDLAAWTAAGRAGQVLALITLADNLRSAAALARYIARSIQADDTRAAIANATAANEVQP